MRRVVLLCILLAVGLLWALPADAATFYARKTGGNDTNNDCTEAQDPSTPKLTIVAAMACAGSQSTAGSGAGDIVDVGCNGAGGSCTYTEELSSFPGGSSTSNRFTLRATPGDVVTIRPNSGFRVMTFSAANASFIEVDGFILDATNVSIDAVKITCSGNCVGTQSNFIRMQNMEVKNAAGGNGILGSGSGCEFYNMNIHHNGGTNRQRHGIYWGGNNTIFERITSHTNAGYGFHIYDSSNVVNNNTIRYSIAHSNGAAPATDPAGFIISSGTGNTMHNNISYNNPVGFQVGVTVTCTDCKVYNNVAYNNTGPNGYGLSIGLATNLKAKNNVFHSNSQGTVLNTGTNTQYDNNLCASLTTGCELAEPTIGNIFVNAAAADFTLVSGSDALNAGVTITDSTCTANNCSGAFNGAAPEIGAYEVAVPTNCEIPLADPGTMIVNFQNNSFPPLQGGAVTQFAVTYGGVAQTESNLSLTGQNQVTFDLGAEPANGAVDVDLVFTAGTLRNSINIGNDTDNSQPVHGASLQCVNNKASATAPGVGQDSFVCHESNEEPGTAYLTDENEGCTLPSPGSLVLMNTLSNDGDQDSPAQGYDLWCIKDPPDAVPEAEVKVTDDCTTLGLCYGFDSVIANLQPTTENLMDMATFDWVAGGAFVKNPSGSVPGIALAQNERTIQGHVLKTKSGVAKGTVYTCYAKYSTGVALERVGTDAVLTIRAPRRVSR